MNKAEKPIPISRGQEINTEKLINKLKNDLKMGQNYYSYLNEQIKTKRVLSQREFMKPLERQNLDLLAALSEEIEELEKHADELLDHMIQGENILQDAKEKLHNEVTLSELIELISELEKLSPEKKQ